MDGYVRKDDLQRLFRKLVDKMVDLLDSDNVTAQDLNVVRQFLKDNSISCSLDEGSPVYNIFKELRPIDD